MSGVKSVAIVGRDAAAWLTALALTRALGRTGLKVTMVELPGLLQPVDVYSALPALAALHRMIGLSEAQILPLTGGVPVLGQRFANWTPGSEFIHGYDTQRPSIGEVDFLQYWVMAQRQGMPAPYDAFSVAAVAASQGRVGRADCEPESLGDVGSGYHLNAPAYAGLLRAAALQLGVTTHRAKAPRIERDGERITAVVLEDGRRIGADLFVDASGSEALLLGGQPGAAWESWREWLPANRLLAASAPRLDPLPSFAQVSAFQGGWLGMFPLQDRTAIVAAYDRGVIGDDRMAATASAVAGVQLDDVVISDLDPGAQTRPWIGNCVAIGEAAIGLEPLDGVQLYFSHLGISHLISLFPVEAGAMPEAAGYNDVVLAHARSLRDFQIAHYRLNGREGEPLWDRARAAPGPASLDAKIALFAARGQVALYDEETFESQNWAAILLGHGLIPRDYSPVADALPREEAVHKFQSFLGLIAEEVRAMPSVAEYLAGGAPEPERRGLY